MKRRDLIKYAGLGSLGAVILAHKLPQILLNEKSTLLDNSSLSPTGQRVIYLLIPSVIGINLDHSLVLLLMQRMESFFKELPIDRKEELDELFSLFDAGFFIKALTKTPLSFSNQADIKSMLDNWKKEMDHFILKNQLFVAYKTLCDLVFISFYSTKQGHQIAGYKSFYADL